jgi:hypothetical protein
MDRDHREIIEGLQISDKIVYTYGYSIENSIYCTCNLSRIAQRLYRTDNDIEKEIEIWAKDFIEKAYGLIVLDCLNARYPKGMKIFGDTCHKFLLHEKSAFLSSEKIDLFYNEVVEEWDDIQIDDISERIKRTNKSLWYHIKGHFLTNAVINLLKNEAARMMDLPNISSLSLDSLYALSIDGCYLCPKEKTKCSDYYDTYVNIQKAIKSVI